MRTMTLAETIIGNLRKRRDFDRAFDLDDDILEEIKQEMTDAIAAHLRERESAKAQAFVPPSNCRQRLKREGRPYPRSSCQACGKWCPRNQDCETLLDAEAINPMLASARVPDAIKCQVGRGAYGEGFDEGWNACRAIMLAATREPEKE